MGFLENLRRQMAAREQEQRAAMNRQKALDQQEAGRKQSQQQFEEAERIRIAAEINRAKVFLRQSDFPRLAEELASIRGNVKIFETKTDGSKVNTGASHFLDKLYGPRKPAQNMAGLRLEWFAGRINVRRAGGKDYIGKYHYQWTEIDNYVEVQSSPSGDIAIIKSGGNIHLPLAVWRGNSRIQEEALGEAYNNPKVIYTKLNDMPGHEDSWNGQGRGGG